MTGSPADPSCNLAEIARLLWTMTVVAGAAGVLAVRWPGWRWVGGLTGAAVVWAWIDMEGPVLVSRGTHGLHVADLPVLIALLAAAVVVVRLWRRRRRGSPPAGSGH